MPFYNNIRDFQKAIDSVLTIDFCLEEIELILIDDCSEDGCSEIAKTYSEKYSFIKLYKNSSNLGPSKALKKALLVAEGDIIIFTAADDITKRNRAKEIYPIFEENRDIGIVVSEADIIDEFGNRTGETYSIPDVVTKENAALYQLKRNICLGAAMAIRNDKEIFIHDYFLESIDDYQIALEFILKGWKIYPLRKKLLYYRVHSRSVSAKKHELHLKTLNVLEHYPAKIFEPKMLDFGFSKNEIDNTLGIFELFKGNSLDALKYFEKVRDNSGDLYEFGYVEHFFYLGLIKFEQGDLDSTLGYWKALLEYDPNNIATLNNLGVLLLQKDNLTGSEFLEKAIKITPNYLDCISNLNKLKHNQIQDLIITRRLLNNNIVKRSNYLEE